MAAAGGGAAVAVLMLLGFWCWWRKRKKRRNAVKPAPSDDSDKGVADAADDEHDAIVRFFTDECCIAKPNSRQYAELLARDGLTSVSKLPDVPRWSKYIRGDHDREAVERALRPDGVPVLRQRALQTLIPSRSKIGLGSRRATPGELVIAESQIAKAHSIA